MQANTFCLDGDAALALEIHGVQHLFVHFALRERPCHFEETVGKRGFAMVDVRDDAEISNELGVHFFSLTNVLDCGQDSNGPPGFSGGPAVFERATHAAQKPCRINIQFATIQRPRQLARPFGAKRKFAGCEGGKCGSPPTGPPLVGTPRG